MQGDYRAFERSGGSGLVWQIAAGVCIGILAASVIQWVAVEARVRWELQQASIQLRGATERVQREQLQSQQAANDRAVAQREALAAAQRQAEESKRAAAQEIERKASAWQQFYRPSRGCGEAGQSVECANEFIRAKRAFEASYAKGGG